jgi:hypothetical protein
MLEHMAPKMPALPQDLPTGAILRVGVICRPGYWWPEWQVVCIDKLLALPMVEASLVIREANTGSKIQSARSVSDKAAQKSSLWQAYQKLRIHGTALQRVDMRSTLRSVPNIHISEKTTCNGSIVWDARTVELVRSASLDFILHFGDTALDAEPPGMTRYGIWQFFHGRHPQLPVCFGEMLNNNPVTEACLQKLTEIPNHRITLRKGCFKTILTSYTLSRNQVLRESTVWPAQVCLDIRHGVAEYGEAEPAAVTPAKTAPPSASQMFRYILKKAHHYAIKLYRSLFIFDHWNIGLVQSPVNEFLKDNRSFPVNWLPDPPPNQFRADPFVINRDEDVYIFFETFDYKLAKGAIACMPLGKDRPAEAKLAIAGYNHLSYPFLIEYEGEMYCVPESSASGEVVIYRAVNFPDEWIKAATLLPDFAGVDPTLFHYAEYWWLAATDRYDGPDYKLHLWYAKDLLGSWHPHYNNPVKMDICSSRPAGTPFVFRNELYRPSQDCSKGYGNKIVLNRVRRLSPVAFEEEPASMILPDSLSPDIDGTHTLCAAGQITLVDGKREEMALKSLAVLKYNVCYTLDNLLKKPALRRGVR